MNLSERRVVSAKSRVGHSWLGDLSKAREVITFVHHNATFFISSGANFLKDSSSSSSGGAESLESFKLILSPIQLQLNDSASGLIIALQ